jgi:hypothetical protein
MKTIWGISDLLGLLSTLSLRVVAVTIFKLSSVIGLIRELIQKTIAFINNMLKLSFIIVLVPWTAHYHRSKFVIIHALVLNCIMYLMKQNIIRATFRCLILLFRVLYSFFPFKRLFCNTGTTCITSVSLHIYKNKKKKFTLRFTSSVRVQIGRFTILSLIIIRLRLGHVIGWNCHKVIRKLLNWISDNLIAIVYWKTLNIIVYYVWELWGRLLLWQGILMHLSNPRILWNTFWNGFTNRLWNIWSPSIPTLLRR